MGANSVDMFDPGKENNKIQYDGFSFQQKENAPLAKLLEWIT